MDIRFISSLTADDENRLAPVLLSMAAALLDGLPLAYRLRLDTAAGRSFEHVHSPGGQSRRAHDDSDTAELADARKR